jgi:methionyl-tRNA synthetase
MAGNTPSRFFISTAIPYVNGAPHIGHALEAVQVDAMARYRRLVRDDTYFLTGSDDNSITNVTAAEQLGVPVGELVARNTQKFIELDQLLDVSYDHFIRTSVDERHKAGSIKLWEAVSRAGDIYQKDYFGLYCPSCELFYDEDELVDGLCPEHLIPPEPVQENNYFFSLSRYQDELEHIIATDQYKVIPTHRKNEVLSFIRSGLKDFSISRSMQRARGWGIPVPGDEGQVMYVWFDALSNYITALGYATDDELYKRYWVDNPNRVHAVGKGIIRFHAVYWPAMLLSAGVPLPTTLFVHGYYTVEGRKMGKSLGNSIDPVQLVQQYGSEAVRYYLLAATHPTGDGDFSIQNFEARYNADLANDLGNLLNRSVAMIARYRDGTVPLAEAIDEQDEALTRKAEELAPTVAREMERFDFQAANAAIWSVVGAANKYVEMQAPWTLAKAERSPEDGGPDRLNSVLHTLAETLRLVSIQLNPFLPRTALEMRAQLGLPIEAAQPDWIWDTDIAVAEPQSLFPRLDRPSETAT